MPSKIIFPSSFGLIAIVVEHGLLVVESGIPTNSVVVKLVIMEVKFLCYCLQSIFSWLWFWSFQDTV